MISAAATMLANLADLVYCWVLVMGVIELGASAFELQMLSYYSFLTTAYCCFLVLKLDLLF